MTEETEKLWAGNPKPMQSSVQSGQPGMVRLRPAKLSDLSLLLAWDREAHVVACDPDDDWDWAGELSRDPPWRTQWMAEVDAVPMGFLQIIDPVEEESQYWGDMEEGSRAIDIWIGPPEYLGKGYGSQMMARALDYCFAAPEVGNVWIDPLSTNHRAIVFYQRLGFRSVGKRLLGDSDCDVHLLTRSEWERSRIDR